MFLITKKIIRENKITKTHSDPLVFQYCNLRYSFQADQILALQENQQNLQKKLFSAEQVRPTIIFMLTLHIIELFRYTNNIFVTILGFGQIKGFKTFSETH